MVRRARGFGVTRKRSGTLAVLVPLLLVTANGCPTSHPDPITTASGPIPAGRTADIFRCQGPRRPARIEASCGGTVIGDSGVGLHRDVGYGNKPVPLPGNPPCNRSSALLCGQDVEGPYGSYVLACNNANDQPHGAARLVAPDGSVLVEGACDHGRAVGTWYWWSFGRLAGAVTIVDGQQLGLRVFWSDGGYGHSVEAPVAGSGN